MSGRLSRTARLSILGVLLGLVIAGLVASAWVVAADGTGKNPIDRVDSLRDKPADASATREEVMAAARTFIQRFHTYGPAMLDKASGTLPEYAKVGDLMTPTARTVFDKWQACVAVPVKAQADIVATVQGAGAFAIDQDSARALVAGVIAVSYPSPTEPEKPITFAPKPFQYEVALVRQNGTWLVDDFSNRLDDASGWRDQTDPCGVSTAPAPGQGATPGQQTTPSPSPSKAATP